MSLSADRDGTDPPRSLCNLLDIRTGYDIRSQRSGYGRPCLQDAQAGCNALRAAAAVTRAKHRSVDLRWGRDFLVSSSAEYPRCIVSITEAYLVFAVMSSRCRCILSLVTRGQKDPARSRRNYFPSATRSFLLGEQRKVCTFVTVSDK